MVRLQSRSNVLGFCIFHHVTCDEKVAKAQGRTVILSTHCTPVHTPVLCEQGALCSHSWQTRKQAHGCCFCKIVLYLSVLKLPEDLAETLDRARRRNTPDATLEQELSRELLFSGCDSRWIGGSSFPVEACTSRSSNSTDTRRPRRKRGSENVPITHKL